MGTLNAAVAGTSGLGSGGSAVPGAGNGGSQSVDPLRRWRAKLAQTPAACKLTFSGDSTSEAISAAGYLYYRLMERHTRTGEALQGLAGGWFSNGATTAGSNVVTSATANFTAADVGRAFFPGNVSQITIPAVVATVDSPTQITLAQSVGGPARNASLTATGVRFTVERRITALGYSGLTLAGWLADAAKKAELIAEAPDLLVASWLINDVRLGTTTLTQAIELLRQYIAWVQTNLPNTDLLLRIPNPMLTTNTGGLNYVRTSGGIINPAGLAQTYSDIIRAAYLTVAAEFDRVAVIDIPAELFGTLCRATHPLMADQLHPSPTSGYPAIADRLAARIGTRIAPGFTIAPEAYAVSRTLMVNGGGVGFVDLSSYQSTDPDAAQFPLDNTFVLFTDGVNGPVALTSASIVRPFGAGIRILNLPAPANTFDFSARTGQAAILASTQPSRTPSTNGRALAVIDLPSIAAGATVNQSVSVSGARAGTNGAGTAVLCAPPAAFHTAGLRLMGVYATADDTATMVINNPTGGAVDMSADNFVFFVVR